MCEKFCETCAYWKGAARNTFGVLWGQCSVLGGETYYVQTEEAKGIVTRSEFGCSLHRERSAGPFVATDSTFGRCTHVAFGNSGEGFSVSIKRDEADRLVEWLNELWAERGQ